MGSQLCGAKKRQGPGTCKRPAGAGTDHPGIGKCKLHGGQSPSGRTSAARQKLDQEVRTLLNRENLVPVDNPLHQIQMLCAEVLRLKDILAGKVEELTSWTYTDEADHEDVKAILQAYERALDRSDRVLVGMARLDIDARMVRLNEAQASLLQQVVMAVLDSRELGLDKEARLTGRTILAREIVSVSASVSSPAA